MNKTSWTVVAVAILAVVGYLAFAQKPVPASGEAIKIGAALGLSGDCAIYGEGELKAARLAIDEANKGGGVSGRPLELIAEDTQCSPKGSVNAIKKLIEVDNVEAIVGLTWGDSYQAGYTVNNTAEIVSVAPSTSLEALYYNNAATDYVFSTWFPAKVEIDSLQAYANKVSVRKFVVVHDVDPYGAMVANLFQTRANQNGLEIIKEYKLPIGTDDFRTIITQIKELEPEGVAVFFQAPDSKAKFLKQAYELGLKSKTYTDASVEDPSLLDNFGAAMEGLIYTFPEVTGNKEAFFRAFKKEYGVDSAGASDANAYDATRVIITALKDHHGKGADLKTAVQNVNFPGTAVAQIKFDGSHQITGALFQIKTVRNGEFTVVQ